MDKGKLQLVKDDPYLEPYEKVFEVLHARMNERIGQFQGEGGLLQVAGSYKRMGVHKSPEDDNQHVYSEWAPGAQQISIFGEFNNWKRNQYLAQKDKYGHWKCKINKPIPPLTKVKCEVKLPNGQVEDRIPAWINYTHQNNDHTFDGVYVPLQDYEFQHPKPTWQNTNLRVYECHIGMCGIEPKVHSFTTFKDLVLPKVVEHGYNVIQIMGILQHPYYGSFGYQVSNFFSVSSRFGTPNELKQLIDEAHKHNIKVIIDIVHAHAAKNINEGINQWDGTDYQYFHSGDRGYHALWDSKIFDYSKYEVLRFLLANVRFWLEEYNADGFRFDAVTSILYHHHGINYSFTGNYQEYFNEELNYDGVVFLMLATLVARNVYKQVILIAEDVSGMPGLCRTHEDGGIGFNFRLSMALPTMWIKLMELRDEDWDIEHIVHVLTNNRWKQPCISYAQSHDQALVGDKTLAMWLFNAEIYTNMSVLSEETPTMFRGMALHKMIRLITFGLGGDAYLNFMGNEFGHPQWIDFPREGNNWSYHYCRRRWDLLDDKLLKYGQLYAFDKAMINIDVRYNVLNSTFRYIWTKDNHNKVAIFQKGLCVFVFNFHPNNSLQKYPVRCSACKSAKVILSTDDECFGGHSRVAHQTYSPQTQQDAAVFYMYIPNRSATVLLIDE